AQDYGYQQYGQPGAAQPGAAAAGYAQPGAAAQAGTAQDYGYQQYGQPGAAQPGAAAAGYAQPGAAAQAGTAQDYGYQQYGQTSSPAAPAGRSSSGAETSAPANGNGAAGGGGPYAREDADRRTATGRQVVRPRGDDSWTGISDPPRRSQRGSGKGYGTGAVSARSGPISTRTAGAVPSARTGAVATRTGAVPTRTGAVPTRTGPVTEDRSSRRGRTGLNLPGRQGKERKTEEKREPQTPAEAVLSVVSEVFVVLGMALALSLVIKTFLIQAFLIPSESMQDTLTFRDRVLVNKLTPSPMSLSRGDVVVFKDPGGWLQEHQETEQQGAVQRGLTAALTFIGLLPQDAGQHLIKRVIGLPGDTVKCCDAEGKLTVNGVPITETYLKEGVKPSNDPFTTTVKPDHLWVLGDNRSNSYDSRFHVKEATQGQVPIANVVGKAFVLVWPFSRFTGLSGPPEVFARVPDPPAAGQK
ncbi:MAG: signal peptidase, partial [Actinomycetota bacterium]|nr:signal peptidase [Actinomycetota bacterium]